MSNDEEEEIKEGSFGLADLDEEIDPIEAADLFDEELGMAEGFHEDEEAM